MIKTEINLPSFSQCYAVIRQQLLENGSSTSGINAFFRKLPLLFLVKSVTHRCATSLHPNTTVPEIPAALLMSALHKANPWKYFRYTHKNFLVLWITSVARSGSPWSPAEEVSTSVLTAHCAKAAQHNHHLCMALHNTHRPTAGWHELLHLTAL